MSTTREYSPANNPTVVRDVPIGEVEPSPLNPRTEFAEEGLRELAESIRAEGIIEPLVVRALPADAEGGTRYGLIAGERRLRAAGIAGLATVPVHVLSGVDDDRALRLMLIENLQRRDLSPLEEASGYVRLRDELGMTQAEIAAAVGRSQPAVAKTLGLLELPEPVRHMLRDGASCTTGTTATPPPRPARTGTPAAGSARSGGRANPPPGFS